MANKVGTAADTISKIRPITNNLAERIGKIIDLEGARAEARLKDRKQDQAQECFDVTNADSISESIGNTVSSYVMGMIQRKVVSPAVCAGTSVALDKALEECKKSFEKKVWQEKYKTELAAKLEAQKHQEQKQQQQVVAYKQPIKKPVVSKAEKQKLMKDASNYYSFKLIAQGQEQQITLSREALQQLQQAVIVGQHQSSPRGLTTGSMPSLVKSADASAGAVIPTGTAWLAELPTIEVMLYNGGKYLLKGLKLAKNAPIPQLRAIGTLAHCADLAMDIYNQSFPALPPAIEDDIANQGNVLYKKRDTGPDSKAKYGELFKPIPKFKDSTVSGMPPDMEPDDDGDENSFDPSRKENHDKVERHEKYGKFYRDANDSKVWYSKDRAGHGGEHWKKFTKKGEFLIHDADIDLTGKVMTKHKGPIGMQIERKQLIGIK